jgi:bifunctional non-homologous end joining protein LigD
LQARVAPAATRSARPYLEIELAHALRRDSAILDGEVVCLDEDGRSDFKKPLFRREWPFFFAFDLFELDGRDLRQLPLIERRIRLKRIMPKVESRVRYVGHIEGKGSEFFRLACEHDLEGVVGKWKFGTYRADGGADLLGQDQEPGLLQVRLRHC